MPENLDTRDHSHNWNFDESSIEESASGNLIRDAAPRESHFGMTENIPEPLTNEKLIEIARAHLRKSAPDPKTGPVELLDFVPDPIVKRTIFGDRIVNFQQHFKGIPIFQMYSTVCLGKEGELIKITGSGTGIPADLDPSPKVSLKDAALAAAKYMGSRGFTHEQWTNELIPNSVDVTSFQPKVKGDNSQPLLLDKGPFSEDIPAHLVFFKQNRSMVRLGWHLIITTKNMSSQYVVIVEADSKPDDTEKLQILYGQEVSFQLRPAHGDVWLNNPKTHSTRERVNFPRPLNDYPVPPLRQLRAGFQFNWIGEENITSGNNIVAGLMPLFDKLKGKLEQDEVVFAPDEDKGNDQRVLNAFYFCNFMHDFFFLLGFDEGAGAFQRINPFGEDGAGDELEVQVEQGVVERIASITNTADGVKAVMKLGLVRAPDFHTALDSDVVFHEYTHGVTNRLVGSSKEMNPLQRPQSRGISEGTSDYFALSIKNCLLDAEHTVLQDWLLDEPDRETPKGIRRKPYDDAYGTAPNNGTYGKIGTRRFILDHHIGEIWAATLMKMDRDLITALGDNKRGHILGWRIVICGLDMLCPNPSFIQARNGILLALDRMKTDDQISEDVFTKARKAVWGAFAHFGMGNGAKSESAELSGITEDKSLPLDL